MLIWFALAGDVWRFVGLHVTFVFGSVLSGWVCWWFLFLDFALICLITGLFCVVCIGVLVFASCFG